jgi:signal peptidase I
MWRIISTVVTVLLGILWFIFLRPTVLGGSTSYVIVSGTSMEPTLYQDDLVIAKKQDSYKVGDIVTFHAENSLVIHRIVGLPTADEGYTTQGDNKQEPDPWHPTDEEVLGRKWVHIPGAGSWLEKLRQPMGLAMIAAALTFVIMLGSSGGGEQAAVAQPGFFDRLWLFIVGYVSGSEKDFRALWRKARRPVEENLEYIEYQSFTLSDKESEPAPTPDTPLDEVGRFVEFHTTGFLRDVRTLWRRYKQQRRENR